MKKFLGLIVLLVALVVCVTALAACNPDSGNQATPQSIQFIDGDGVNSEKVTSEVYLVFRGGEYVGHEINTTVKIGEANTTYFLQFALTN